MNRLTVNTAFILAGVVALSLGFIFVLAIPALAQQVAPAAEPETFAEWLPIAMTAVLSGIGLFIGLAIRYLVAQVVILVPDVVKPMVTSYLSKKFQDNLQKGITSAISRILLEGRFTSVADALDEIKEHLWDSVPDTVNHFDLKKVGDSLTDKVIGNIAADKVIEVSKNLAIATDAATSVKETVINSTESFNSAEAALKGQFEGLSDTLTKALKTRNHF